MGRAGGCILICAAVAVAVLLASVTGVFTEKQQLHTLGVLWKVFIVAFLPVLAFFGSLPTFRNSCEWAAQGVGFRNWFAFWRLADALILEGGFWAWFSYFGDHGAFITWPIIVAVLLLAIWIAGASVEDRLSKLYAETIANRPLPKPGSAEASGDDWGPLA